MGEIIINMEFKIKFKRYNLRLELKDTINLLVVIHFSFHRHTLCFFTINIFFTFCTQNTINYSVYRMWKKYLMLTENVFVYLDNYCWWVMREIKESLWIKKTYNFEPLGLDTKLDRHWLFINKIPRNQRYKLFYLLCNVMLFVFHICNKLHAYLLYIYLYLKSLNNLHKILYINFRTLRPCGLPQRKFRKPETVTKFTEKLRNHFG
jgi:hypothetical protein